MSHCHPPYALVLLRCLIWVLLLAASIQASVQAQTMALQKPIDLPIKALQLTPTQRIVVDGDLNDPAWDEATPMTEFYEVEPNNMASPKVRTEIRFAFDARTLYVAVTAWDPDLSALRAEFSRRDDLNSDEDHITIYLDPTGQRKFAQFFDINPRGMVTDGLYNEQTGNEDISPDFHFLTRTGRFADGWTIELAIPFTSLRYMDAPLQRWHVLVTRNYPRADESRYFASGPLPRESNCLICYGRPLIGFQELPSSMAWSVTPTLTSHRRRDSSDTVPSIRSSTTQLGADLKWRLRSDTFIDATLRPDFSQVEVDTPQLSSNNRFALFFPEKRSFFLEGSDILESPLPALQTRSITAPEWGLRMTRRGEDADFALIAARDQAMGDILLPSVDGTESAEKRFKSLATMGRGRLHLGQATLGALFSDRRYDGDLGSNRLVGLDGSWNPTPESRGDLQWLTSRSRGLQLERGMPDSGRALFVRWSHKSDAWSTTLSGTEIGRGFRGDNGFFQEAGIRTYKAELRDKYHNVGPYHLVSPYTYLDLKSALGGPTLLRTTHVGLTLGFPLETSVWLVPLVDVKARANRDTPLRSLRQVLVGVKSVPSGWLNQTQLEAFVGDQLDVVGDRVGRGYKLKFETRLRPSQRLQFAYWLEEQRIGIDERGSRQSLFSERVQQLLALLHLGTDHHLRLILQSRHTKRNIDLFAAGTVANDRANAISLTYQWRRDNRFIVDAGISNSKERGLPSDFRRMEEDVFLKLSWTLGS